MGPPSWPRTDLVTHRVEATPTRTALVDADRDREWSYRDLDAAVDDAAAALSAVAPAGGRVGVLVGTRPEFVTLVHAAQRCGLTLVLLDPEQAPDRLASRLDRADADALVCEAATETAAAEIAPGPVLSVDGPGGETAQAIEDVGGDPPTPVEFERDRTQVVAFTSGTTGEPAGVRLTAGNLLAGAVASAFRLGVDPDDRWLAPLPMHHVGGLAPALRCALYGTALVLQRSFDATETMRVVESAGVTGLSLVPTQLRRLLDAGWTPPEGLRFVLLGGAPAGRDLIERCEAAGVPVCPTYGLTEAASQVATARPGTAFAHPESVGEPLAFTTVSIVDADGHALPPGETGEIVVDGPTVTPDYLDERTPTTGERGLHTGDLGYRDADGHLYVTGRVDDRIVTGGENVDPVRVAEVLEAHPAVAETVVVGVPDEEWGERVGALVVPEAGGDPTADALEAHCRERLAGYEVPKSVEIVEDLPRTASGTVDRDRARDRLAE